MKIAKLFQILAVILVGVAAYFLWDGNKDGVFVALVLSGCAYFLNWRFQAKERLKAHQEMRKATNENEAEEATDE